VLEEFYRFRYVKTIVYLTRGREYDRPDGIIMHLGIYQGSFWSVVYVLPHSTLEIQGLSKHTVAQVFPAFSERFYNPALERMIVFPGVDLHAHLCLEKRLRRNTKESVPHGMVVQVYDESTDDDEDDDDEDYDTEDQTENEDNSEDEED
jgi:hypothetical protein